MCELACLTALPLVLLCVLRVCLHAAPLLRSRRSKAPSTNEPPDPGNGTCTHAASVHNTTQVQQPIHHANAAHHDTGVARPPKIALPCKSHAATATLILHRTHPQYCRTIAVATQLECRDEQATKTKQNGSKRHHDQYRPRPIPPTTPPQHRATRAPHHATPHQCDYDFNGTHVADDSDARTSRARET